MMLTWVKYRRSREEQGENVAEKKNTNYELNVLVITIIGIILFFGLSPKDYPIFNNVQWSPETGVLRFQNPSLVYSDDLGSLRDQISDDFTLSVKVAVANVDLQGFKPIIMIHDGNDQTQLSIWQWGASLIVMNGDDYDYSRKAPRVDATGVLAGGKAVEIVLSSCDTGTRLFLDGKLVREDKKLRLLIPGAGEKIHLVLGNSVYGKYNWEGEISSLAIYGKALSAQEVSRLSDKLQQSVSAAESREYKPLLLYTFDQKAGTVIKDQSGSGYDLQIPHRFVVLKKSFLSLTWKHLTLKRWFIVDVTLNFIGFIPLGGVLFFRLLLSKPKSPVRAGLMVLAFCFSLSFSIELAQAWLPNRASSILDVALNSLGALAGILLAAVLFRNHSRNSITNY